MLETARPYASVIVLAFLLLWESLDPFFELFNASPRERLRHGGRNMLVAIVNALLVSFIFVGLWAWSAGYSLMHQIGLLHQSEIDPWLRLALVVLLLDGWTYLWHWMNHRLPVLWRFHRMHHADTQMDVTTAGRFHLGEIIFSSLLRLPIILFLGVQLHELVVYEVIMFAVVQFHHANIGLPEKWDRLLRLVIVTPAMHKVHHSNRQLETDSNYTSLFSWWDRIFGTFRLRSDPRTIQFGLDQTPAKDVQSMRAMMKTPFAEFPGTSRGVSVKWVWFSFIAALLATAGCVMMLRDTTMTWDKTYQMIERDFPGVPVITTMELAQWLADADRKPPLLLDVREADEFAVSHLKGAVQVQPNSPVSSLPVALQKDQPVVVYCSVGYRSAALTRRLQQAGYTQVRNLQGSLFEWANQGMPVYQGEQEVQQVHPYDAQWGALLEKRYHASTW